MKKIITLILLIICITSCVCQKVGGARKTIEDIKNYTEVRFDDGYAKYGFYSSVHLTVEGLIYRYSNKIKFVPINELELKGLIELQSFVKDNNILLKNYISDSIEVATSRPPERIVLNNLKGQTNYIEYQYCINEIEKLKLLLIKLIPKDDRDDFQFGKLCK